MTWLDVAFLWATCGVVLRAFGGREGAWFMVGAAVLPSLWAIADAINRANSPRET